MTPANRLKTVFSTILKEVENNPEFASRMVEALGMELSKKDPPQRSGRRKPSPFDPFEAYDKGVLESSLDSLNVEQLKDIIAEHQMDRSQKARKWKAKDKLIPLILTTIASRARKGEAFRLPRGTTDESEAAVTTIPMSAIESDGVQDTLRRADIIEACDTVADKHEQLWGQHSLAAGRAPGAPAHLIKQVEIELDFSKPEELARAKAAIERAKRSGSSR
jgi:hypothetical protein